MLNPFPAVLMGGPPHSGKSVLTYHLSQLLRDRHVEHYVMRACPDGEGDWYLEGPRDLVRILRIKGAFTPEFVARMCDDIGRRHLPLLVDVGGRPTPEQERIFDQCTHAILVAADESGLAWWHASAERHGLAVVAELRSTLTEAEVVDSHTPVLTGRIAGLERHAPLQGFVVHALADRLERLFRYYAADLRRNHLDAAPVDPVIEVDQILHDLHDRPGDRLWQPADLPKLLARLPGGVPMAAYGRGPGWLYGALAWHALPAAFHQFDVRLGWVTPPRLVPSGETPGAALAWQCTDDGDALLLEFSLPQTIVDYLQVDGTSIPNVPAGRGVVISGKLPHWLICGLVRAYAACPWVAVYQPQLLRAGVVVGTRVARHAVGDVLEG